MAILETVLFYDYRSIYNIIPALISIIYIQLRDSKMSADRHFLRLNK